MTQGSGAARELGATTWDGAAGGYVTVRYFAAARAATGVSEERIPIGLTLADLTSALAARHGERLTAVLKVASYLVNGLAWHDHDATLPAGATVDVLPPFAGG